MAGSRRGSGDGPAIVPAFRNYVRNTLTFSQAAVEALALQGVTDFEHLDHLTKPDMDQICKNIKKPGGDGHGVLLGQLQEKRLKMLLYFKKFLIKIQRPFTVQIATVPNLIRTYALYEREKTHEEAEITEPKKFTKDGEVRVVFESIDHYLSKKLGTAKVPLPTLLGPMSPHQHIPMILVLELTLV